MSVQQAPTDPRIVTAVKRIDFYLNGICIHQASRAILTEIRVTLTGKQQGSKRKQERAAS